MNATANSAAGSARAPAFCAAIALTSPSSDWAYAFPSSTSWWTSSPTGRARPGVARCPPVLDERGDQPTDGPFLARLGRDHRRIGRLEHQAAEEPPERRP